MTVRESQEILLHQAQLHWLCFSYWPHALQSPTTFRRLKEQKARFLDEDHVPVVAAQRDGCFEP